MPASAEPREGPAPVRFGQRSTRGLLLGLSAARCLCAGTAVSVVVLGLAAGGGVGLVASGLVWVPLLAATYVSWNGQALCEWAPVVGHWTARKAARQSEYRARVSAPRPAGTMALPGDAAALRFYEDADSGACMVHDPHRQTLSVTVAVTHPAYVLLSAGDQASRVSAWGRLLASLSRSGYCAAIQVLEATVPDPGTGVAGWYERRGTHGGGWADSNYAELLRQSSHGSSAHRSTITISLDMRTRRQGHSRGRPRHQGGGCRSPRPDGGARVLAAGGRSAGRALARRRRVGRDRATGLRPRVAARAQQSRSDVGPGRAGGGL